jgi:hypothetical protein
MRSAREERAADEPASAPQGDELAARVTPPIPQDRLNFQASQWPPLDQADPERFLAGLRQNRSERRGGRAAAVVFAGEFERRFPATSSVGVRESLEAAYDARLGELAGAVWTAGVA